MLKTYQRQSGSEQGTGKGLNSQETEWNKSRKSLGQEHSLADEVHLFFIHLTSILPGESIEN